MASLIKEFEHLEIPLEEIKSATNNFDNSKVIGKGGFGKVYVGEVSHSKGRNMVAIKRLDSKLGQGGPEFLKEITMLSCYTHENLISLLGFCNQEDEMILLYEYASNGSLDHHLGDTTLTWRQRIKICLDAAKGLSYLHDPNGAHQRVLHCDIKSANILLDDQWNGKVSDFGLSKIGPANQQNSFIVTNALGTPGYCDPLFMETYSLTKESDVYSFGVVLFEVLCGVLCFQYSKAGHFNVLVPMWKKKYKQNKIDEIVFPDIRQPMDPKALETFSDIAYRCLHKCRKERPVMAEVVEKLEMALESQEASEGKEWIIRTMVPPLNYTSEVELNILLCKGVLLNGGKTWFSLNDNEEYCVMISIADCLIHNANDHNISRYKSGCNSRFSMSYLTNGDKFQTHVRTRMLSPRITYIVNIVFKFLSETQQRKGGPIDLKYKLAGERNYSTVYLANKREDDWLMAELYYFISDGTSVDLEIVFDYHKSHIVVEGIEFRPLEKAGNEVLEDEKVDTQPISDEDTYWEKILPNDYEDIIKWSKDSEQWTTKKELYFNLRKGFLINNDEWFYVDKNGKKCHMLSARAASVNDYWSTWYNLPRSRFGDVFSCDDNQFSVGSGIKSRLVSPQKTYAYYLIYALPRDQSKLAAPLMVRDKDLGSKDWNDFWYIHLVAPEIPLIIKGKVDENTHNPLNRPNMKGIPRKRSDGWMEVLVFEFQLGTNTGVIPGVEFRTSNNTTLKGIIIQGIELRPI